ncbi:MAG: sialate O-acetylesterase [Synoicihabitans sp.]
MSLPLIKSNSRLAACRKIGAFAFAIAFVLLPIALRADANNPLRLASLFQDHMVLQRDMPVPIWGEAQPGEHITVTFHGQSRSTQTNARGKWQVRLSPLAGTDQPAELRIQAESDDSVVVIQNVVVGEVWICSGQSNMQMAATVTPELKALYESSTGVHSFTVRRTVAFTEQDYCEGEWIEGPPNSAVALTFAHHLRQKIDVPVGIVLSSWGSSSLEAWMPGDMTAELPYLKTIVGEFAADAEKQQQIKTALAKGKWSREEDILMRRQSILPYNAMMHPLIPYAARGLVWYQGERNSRFISGMPDEPAYMRVAGIQEYDEALIAWMRRYRRAWSQDRFHFLAVMLPGYGRLLDTSPVDDHQHPSAHSWAWMRESQLVALALPDVAVANTIDLGDENDIHPKDKQPIGERLALLAVRDTLGQKIVAQGPVMKRVKANQGELIVHFDHAMGLRTKDGEAPQAFWIADNSENWAQAEARIVGETVVLTSATVAKPRHVRYAWAGKPEVNLVNGAGLPAYPFRTDNFAP